MKLRLLRRFLVYPALLLLSLLVLVMVGVGAMLHSQQGSRWLVGKAQQFAPGELLLERFTGSFTGPMQILGLTYRDGDLLVEIERIDLDWRPAELLDWRLHLLELSLEGTRLKLPVSEENTVPDPQQPFAGVNLPLELLVESLRIEDLQWLQPDGADPLTLERLILQAQAVQQRVTITRLEAAAFSAQMKLSGGLELIPGLPLELQTEWNYRVPDGPELQGQGAISGSLDELQVKQILAAPIAGVLSATLFELEKLPRWDASLALDKSDVGAFVKDFPARLSGRLQSSGTAQRVEANGQLDFFEPSLGKLNIEFRSQYADGEVTAEQLRVTGSDGMQLEGQGRYSLDDMLGVLAADLKWQGLKWPLIGEQPQFFSKDGRLTLEGSPEDYRYRLELDAQLPDLPPALGRLKSTGSGSLQGLALDELSLVMQEGRLLGNGRVAWLPEPSWQANLNGEALNPGLFHAEFPGNLSLVLNTRGQIHESVPHAEVVLQKLEGQLRGYPLKSKGKILLDAEQLSFKSLQVISGANQANVEGIAGKTLDLNWSVQAPELNTLWPDLSGALKAQGILTGLAELPRITATVNAKDVAYQENRIGALDAEMVLGLDAGQQIDVQLKAGQLAMGGQVWDELLLDASGLRNNHHIGMQLTGRQVPEVKLGLDAGLDEDFKWQGKLNNLALELLEYGRWDLTSPADFILTKASQSLQRSCLGSGQAVLCGSFKAQADAGWQAALQASEIPFSMLQHWLPEEIRIAGHGNLQADVAAQAGQEMRGSANLKIPAGSLEFDLGGEAQNIDFSGGTLTASLDGRSGRGEVNLPLAGLGGIEGEVTLPGFKPAVFDMQSQAMQGQVKARIEDLGLLSVMLPNLQNVRGAVVADFTLAGSLAEPSLQGAAELQGGALDIPELGLELRELGLNVVANDLQRVTLNGSVRSGDGRLTLSGETQLQSDQGFPTELQIKGENWVAVNIPQAEVHISPDINIKHNSDRSGLNGAVHIPYARIRPRDIPASAVSASSDVVVVGGDSEPVTKADPRFHSKLRITFGDRVSFEGMGLKGNLTGNLLVTDEPGRPVTGSGRVGVVDGTYRAYGQDLKIERGYALFAESPVDNPGLDVRAVREVEDVTAGLRVTGTLKKPKLSLFSTPAMAESAVLSYLLTGRAPGESSGKNVGVSAALQASGAGNLATEVGRQLGLEELRVDTGGAMDEASVVAGTYLSPRLYVQYVNDLATRETKLRLRYDLTKRLQIQTESGQSQGVDLFYTIER